MSLRTLPILFLNMGGEMLYILEQRLTAQSVKREKAAKVLNDIATTMLSDKLLSQMFQAQEIYSRKAMRSLFDKLAHTSIMRLNATSMDKLYDLMTMAVKQQVQAIRSPGELLLMTLCHLDGIRNMISFCESTVKLVDCVYKQLESFYFDLTRPELYLIRQTFLSFFQDIHVKVSILLREKKQTQTGYFFIAMDGMCGHGVKPPGTICIIATDGTPFRQSAFHSGCHFEQAGSPGNTDRIPPPSGRGTDLGTNMYKDYSQGQAPSANSPAPSKGENDPPAQKKTSAAEELKLLNLLIGSEKDQQPFNFNLDFLNDGISLPATSTGKQVSRSKSVQPETQTVVKVDARGQNVGDALDRLAIKEPVKRAKSQGQDLLDMMDNA